MRQVVGDIISPDQTCGIPGRSITSNLHLIRNVIDYCEYSQHPSVLVTFDQSKVFDRVSHRYLFAVLERFGFGPSFIKWVQLLYSDIGSQVIVNGFLSDFFPVSRSVRQGCGLSPLLYALSIVLELIQI